MGVTHFELYHFPHHRVVYSHRPLGHPHQASQRYRYCLTLQEPVIKGLKLTFQEPFVKSQLSTMFQLWPPISPVSSPEPLLKQGNPPHQPIHPIAPTV